MHPKPTFLEHQNAAEHAKRVERAERHAYQELRSQFIQALYSELGRLIETPAFSHKQMPLEAVVLEQASEAWVIRRLLRLLRLSAGSTDNVVKAEALDLAEALAHQHGITHREDMALGWTRRTGRPHA